MAPYNLAIFSVASAAVEGTQPLRQLLGANSTFVEQVYLAGSLLSSCCLACAFNVASYLIIKHMSPVGATVIANAKTPATILTSVLIFGNTVGALQILGFVAPWQDSLQSICTGFRASMVPVETVPTLLPATSNNNYYYHQPKHQSTTRLAPPQLLLH
ncbi:unnamed protein product [Symbiodinium pilosum]|uniref:Sugar phosphate transporter domain-containing protein n=1 Tax=Symbiodinium pilosum TaxID=2952 RepID=A0A812UNY4_SYMPI|nr:unnamed protein product [Symbiodinium pilosum]